MTPIRIILLVLIGVLSAAGTIAAIGIHLEAAAHPLSTHDPWIASVVYCLPYLFLCAAGSLTYHRTWFLVWICVATGLTVLMTTAACYGDFQTSNFMLEARAAGRRGMVCGPPASFFVLPITYGISSILMMIGLVFLPSHIGRFIRLFDR